MNRFTRYDEKQKQYVRLASRLAVDNKLGKLEDLEEQLDCLLEIVFKALKNGIYTKESELDKELELYDVRGIDLRGLGVISKICSYGECDFTCYYKNYKKTWFLRKDKSE